jgi:hypothetical protein
MLSRGYYGIMEEEKNYLLGFWSHYSIFSENLAGFPVIDLLRFC